MSLVVITGASRGIGLALAEQYVDADDEVIAICRNAAAATDLVILAEHCSNLTICEADVTNQASLDRVRDEVGDRPVDLVLNVAGIISEELRLDDTDLSVWSSLFETMITGPFRVAKMLLPNLQAASGKLVSITSKVGASDWAYGGYYSYAAAKAGLNRGMQSLAIDLKERGVTIALVHPGHVQTELGGPAAEITSEESARGIRDVVASLTMAQTGSFLNWDGTSRAW